MSKYKEFWIRKGTNGFDYKSYDIDSEKEDIVLSSGDQFYDAVLEVPAIGGIHVIEYKAYEDVVKAHDEMVRTAKHLQDLLIETGTELQKLLAEK